MTEILLKRIKSNAFQIYRSRVILTGELVRHFLLFVNEYELSQDILCDLLLPNYPCKQSCRIHKIIIYNVSHREEYKLQTMKSFGTDKIEITKRFAIILNSIIKRADCINLYTSFIMTQVISSK